MELLISQQVPRPDSIRKSPTLRNRPLLNSPQSPRFEHSSPTRQNLLMGIPQTARVYCFRNFEFSENASLNGLVMPMTAETAPDGVSPRTEK